MFWIGAIICLILGIILLAIGSQKTENGTLSPEGLKLIYASIPFFGIFVIYSGITAFGAGKALGETRFNPL